MRVLLLSPHTDDVELGAGGLVCRLMEEGGHTFKWLVFSRCEDSLGPNMAPDTLEREFYASADSLAISDRHVLGLPVRTMSAHRQEVLETLVKTRHDFNPDLVVGPCLDDVHQDHATVAQEALRAFKGSATVLGYELPRNNITFSARLLVRLAGRHVQRKWQLVSCYQSQFTLNREYFSWETMAALATVRGSQCGSVFAEAFDVVRAVL